VGAYGSLPLVKQGWGYAGSIMFLQGLYVQGIGRGTVNIPDWMQEQEYVVTFDHLYYGVCVYDMPRVYCT